MSLLQQANSAYQRQDYAAAIPLYVRAMQHMPDLAPVLRGSLQRAQKAWQRQSKARAGVSPAVLIHGWDLSHNAAGRAATLAQIWKDLAEVKLTGFLYPPPQAAAMAAHQRLGYTPAPHHHPARPKLHSASAGFCAGPPLQPAAPIQAAPAQHPAWTALQTHLGLPRLDGCG